MVWLLPASEQVPSPNMYPSRSLGTVVDLLVIHYAVDARQSRSPDAADVARGFARSSRKASAHFVIGRDGSRRQCVSLSAAAWHAGDGTFPDTVPCDLKNTKHRARHTNMRSVGIELCNVGWAVEKFAVPAADVVSARHRNPASRSPKWERFTLEQVNSLEMIVALSTAAMPSLRWVCGHEDITHQDTLGRIGAKTDPGPAFDWGAIDWARYGLTYAPYDFAGKRWAPALAKDGK